MSGGRRSGFCEISIPGRATTSEGQRDMKILLIIFLMMVLVLSVGCTSDKSGQGRKEPTVEKTNKNKKSGQKQVDNKQVTLKGMALNAKGGAVLVTEAKGPIYVEGLDAWPDEFLDAEVQVTGLLTSKKIIPDPVVDEHGAVSTGAEGNQMVLEKATWKK